VSAPRPETPYSETEMLLAVLDDNGERLQELIDGSSMSELLTLNDALDSLQDAISRAIAIGQAIR
jgi:hypothetical protein